jgi:protein TonB
MKYLAVVMMLMTLNSFSQTGKTGTIKIRKPPCQNEIMMIVDQMPDYPGGSEGLFQFISQNVTYPRSAMEKGLSGTVYTSIIVNTDGTISGHEIIQGVKNCPECDLEALRVIKMLGPFNPGMNEGKPVQVRFTIPIRFRLK